AQFSPNAGGQTCGFFVYFNLPTIKPLVEQYLGGLPAGPKAVTWRDHGIRPPDGVVQQTVRKGIEPRAQTRIVFHGAIDQHDQQAPTAYNAMGAVLQNQLREALREDLGGTYSVGAPCSSSCIRAEQ